MPSGIASGSVELPSLRLAGATCTPLVVCTMFTASAWLISPACSSETFIVPPRYDRPDAATPYGQGKTPSDVLTPVIRPPQHDVHCPAASFPTTHISHAVSVEGCQIARLLSVPAAGCASGGIGTAANWRRNEGSELQAGSEDPLTFTVRWSWGTR